MAESKYAKYMLVEAEYYSRFHCLASRCRNDCCHGWRIDINRANYNRIRSAEKSPDLERLAAEGIRRNKRETSDARYAEMQLRENGDCVFLNEDRMCRLQIECGYAMLPKICKSFPRNTAIIGNTIEKCATTACEEVVKLLWEIPDKLKFLCGPLEEMEVDLRLLADEKHPAMLRRMLEVQTLCIDILQNRAYTLDGRVILLGMAIRTLAEYGETNDDSAIEKWLQRYAALASGNDFQSTLDKLPKEGALAFANSAVMIQSLTWSARGRSRELFDRILALLHYQPGEEGKVTFSNGAYRKAKESLNVYMQDKEYLLENVMVNQWFHDWAPFGESGVWQSYLRFAVQYSLLKFMLAGGVGEEITKEDVVAVITLWSRMLAHNRAVLQGLVDKMIESESDTLAHVAILVNG